MKLPKKISPCPIIDALLEVRFSINIDRDAVFGLIYNSLKDDFKNVEKLPIMQLPDKVRATDDKLRFKPHYRLVNDNFVVQVGPEVVTIGFYQKYAGWEIFSKKIYDILDKIEKIGIIDSIIRIGLRYINFFEEEDIFNHINLDVSLHNSPITYKNTVIRTEIEQENYNSTLQIANNATNNDKSGSIIDIDTFLTDITSDFFSQKEDIINKGHEKEKELFFSLLKEDFLNKKNPEY